MRLCRLRLELRMKLDGDVPRMVRHLRDLHELAVRRPSGDAKPAIGQRLFVQAVEAAKTHGPTEIIDAKQISQLVNQLYRCLRRALRRIGVAQSGDVAGEL